MQVHSPKPRQIRRPSATRRSAAVFTIESRITILRHQKVILDSALAELYGASVKRLNQQVNRNRERFPSDFMFQITPREFAALRLQFATSNKKRGGRRSLPYAFTEHGAIMAATVLNSDQAVEMSVFVVRAFVRLRADAGHKQRTRGQDRRIGNTHGDARRRDPGNLPCHQETDEPPPQSPKQDRIRAPAGTDGVAGILISPQPGIGHPASAPL